MRPDPFAVLHKPNLLPLGCSSDDSYLSADEEPAEAPRFERPLQDTTEPGGSEVTLKCIVSGNPAPTGEELQFIDYIIRMRTFFPSFSCVFLWLLSNMEEK